MKIRFRSIDGKGAAKLEVPNTCTLRQLQRILLDHIAPPSPSVVRFSLNRKDELQASSGDETLQSLGVASGDLLFYTLLPDGSRNPLSPDPDKAESGGDPEIPGRGFDSQGPDDDSGPSPREIDLIGKDSAALYAQEVMDLDEVADVDAEDFVAVCGKFSEPYFLRKVLMKELGVNNEDVKHRSVVLAVHAVMLESGFVAIDPVTKMPVDGFHLPEQWPSPAYSMSLNYSFPEIPLGHGSIFLRFQTLGRFMNVYGSLDNGMSDMPRVCLDGSVLSPKIASVLSSCDYDAAKGVFEFWKLVKDNLVLPMSINLSERAGLVLPSCFARLPMELKAKILESLSGVDLAKVACVCSELHYLSENNDLWKLKCVEEFGYRAMACYATATRALVPDWRRVFRQSWMAKRTKSEPLARPCTFLQRQLPSFNRIRRDPRSFGYPAFIGGDYDRLPTLGIPNPHGGGGGQGALPVLRDLSRRGVIPRCNLRGVTGSL